ncbi:glycosyl hydrolase [Flavobacterium piscis]|uniref:Fibronectin type 3 domain-containing protein/ethanolamine utilization microcompartment shell protein EutS n=1 Tax=Flavobacterium piscis TaxID=1114874 RepID=A0ABU1Y5Z5_9FLAO|nr:glycosyl hydrolase [Flavobacterium piscis]MDR7209563.1 fibronectin type 3 domain-containing protein/ethanolamine utilization microcompartment shell protein EutS [Flavobacterium piscis]
MKKLYTLLFFGLSVFLFRMQAQTPNLPVKVNLATSLSGSKTFSNSTTSDVISFPLSNQAEFTLEVKAKVNSAQGRGLDVEVKNTAGLGFRTSLDKTTFNHSTVLSAVENLSTSVDNAQEQTYRYAVKNGFVNIYQDGHFLASKTLDFVNNTSGTQDVVYGPDNLLGKWAGVTGNNSGKPNDYGWANTSASLPWNTANSTSGVRYLDVTSGHTFESDNTTYNGRIMYIRWDNSAYSTSTYSYPVTLEEDLKYEFSWIYEYVSNSAPGTPINVAISAAANGTGVIASKTFVTGNANKLRKGDFSFIATADGIFYITITAGSGLMAIGDLNLKSVNLINVWDGFVNDNSGTPAVYGWTNSVSSAIFNTANSASGVRYMDVTSGHSLESDGANYSGRLLYVRWDGAQENSVYSFPVQLEAAKEYQFSWLYEYISNLAPGSQMNVSVSTAVNGGGTVLATKSFTTGDVNKLRKGDLSFQSQASGTYYINITGDKALFGIGNLKVTEQQMANIVIGKNYAVGAVDMVVSSVTFEDIAYAPEKIISPSTETVELTSNLNVGGYAKSKVVLNSAASLYLKNAYNPLINTTVNLNSANARLYFENKKPSEVISSYLQYISFNGVPAGNGSNVQVTNYGSGAVVAPYSVNEMPLEVFTSENFGGTSQQYAPVTPHDNLDTFDNAIKSFKLKKGYMATFATNADGSGYSRVFIAENQDLEVPILPVNLNGTISFIRTMKWHEVNKKGLAGGSIEAMNATNITWYYNWNTGMSSTPNIEYVPIRQTNFWPSFTPAYTKEGYTHLLGFNEPDRPDQANMTVEAAISSWPALMKSGLRLGSPATSDPFNPWMGNFMTQAEANNYRIDYVAIHCYWYKTAAQWKSDLQNVYDRYKRPLWITEWNIGANWTGNNFPDGPTVLTDANAIKHKNDLAAILTVLETTDYVERYSIYNWVQDARAMYVTIDDAFKTRNPNWQNYVWLQTAPVISSTATSYVVLTPAGEYYANNASAKAYSSNREFIPTWKTKAETLSYELSSDYQSITINWTGTNNDLVNKYIVERKLNGENDFSIFYESTDYKVIKQTDQVHSRAEYRIKVVGKDNVESVYSAILVFEQAPIAAAPSDIEGKALSRSIINLKWSAVAGAESYTIKRSESIDGMYEDVAVYLKETTFDDINLQENKDYFYKLASVNTGGESPYSSPLQVKTLSFEIPPAVTNASLAYGDAKVNLEWDFMYDADFYVKRSNSPSGPFTVIATVTANEYQDVAVVNGNPYFYKISAFNALGEGPDSGILSATPAPGQKITGSIIGHSGSYQNSGLTIEKAFDEDVSTFVDGPTAIGYLGYDFGPDKKASLTDIRYVPRNGFGNRIPGSEIRGSNSEDYINSYEVLHVITQTPVNDIFTTDSGLATKKYRYIYWYTPTGYGNIAELEFYGSVDTTLSTNKPQPKFAGNITAYPNPTYGQLDINFPANEDSQKIAIYTVDGKLISESDYAVENGKIHLNLENNSAGFYFVKFQSHPEKTIRIIKK